MGMEMSKVQLAKVKLVKGLVDHQNPPNPQTPNSPNPPPQTTNAKYFVRLGALGGQGAVAHPNIYALQIEHNPANPQTKEEHCSPLTLYTNLA